MTIVRARFTAQSSQERTHGSPARGTLWRGWPAAWVGAALLGGTVLLAAQPAPVPETPRTSTRVKDVASLQGTPPLPLVGYGLVVGLSKTGDRKQTLFSAQSLANLLQRFGVVVAADQIKIENVAAVLVTAELPSFTPAGGRLDVTASSIGDARSLQGGTLLATPAPGARRGHLRHRARGAVDWWVWRREGRE